MTYPKRLIEVDLPIKRIKQTTGIPLHGSRSPHAAPANSRRQVLNYSKAAGDRPRRDLLAAFKEKPEHKVFVGHPKTAGLGLNELVAANYVIHFDHWWNPAVMNQATARAHRPGQMKTVFAYDLWVQGTYEEIIFNLLEQKQGLYNAVVDSMSVQPKPEDNLAFAVADTLFAKYGLKPVQRKSASSGSPAHERWARS